MHTLLRAAGLCCCSAAPLLAQADIANFVTPGATPRDVAINPAGTRAVVVDADGNVRVYDLSNASELTPASPISIGPTSAPGLLPVRSVVCGATRAVVVGFDLSAPPAVKTNIAVIDVSATPFVVGSVYHSSSGAAHDVALAPGGQYAAVNGEGHVWVVRLAGAEVRDLSSIGFLYPPNTPVPLPRSIVASNTRIVAIRATGPQGVVFVYDPTAFVADPEGDPVGGIHALSDVGAPYDLDLSPDLAHAMVVTTGPEHFLFDLTVPVGSLQDKLRIANGACTTGGYRIQDSVELTNGVALVTRITGRFAGRVEVFDVHDPSSFAFPVTGFDVDGWPHDVDASPEGATAVVTSHERSAASLSGVIGLRLPSPAGATVAFALPSGGFLSEAPFDFEREVSESVRVTKDRAVVIANDTETSPTSGRVRVLDLFGAPGSVVLASYALPASNGGGPVFDLELSSDGKRAAVAVEDGTGLFLSLATGTRIGDLPGVGDLRSTPLSNALVMSATRALTAGVDFAGNIARTRIFDTCSALPMPLTICPAVPNTTGQIGTMSLLGSTSIAANDLVLVCNSLPPGTTGYFFYGPRLSSPPVPLATGGTICIGTPNVRFATGVVDANGVMTRVVDLGAPPSPAGQIHAGETWWFQLYHHDPTPTSTNTSDVLQITFGP